ncbi:hypothetical protein AN478_07320 [Thiohalorhabdus denitrificans]|uniref:Helix-turn-helix n=1 Tax=Thiohalorhabdus denitrificans TaxID=381306 RepID=A0A0P9ECK7_9GAMM|nr:antitoxin Xre-like helix-turn-helix domain-containing protein [Thiohalorhabdus denitrificans]KPV39986.1 hypothetical protein AN478_07320 [Thiohalorhabdus denitrificans]SCY11013.1 Helix-turn-helix [Thiohalorhabdus denitrificans]
MAIPAPDQTEQDRRILTEATVNAATQLGLTNSRLAEVIGVSDSTVSRMKRGRYHLDPGAKEWELSLLLVRLFRSLGAICAGDGAVMRQWMASHNRDLRGVPEEAIRRVDGLVEVVDYLDAHRAVA